MASCPTPRYRVWPIVLPPVFSVWPVVRMASCPAPVGHLSNCSTRQYCRWPVVLPSPPPTPPSSPPPPPPPPPLPLPLPPPPSFLARSYIKVIIYIEIMTQIF